MIYREKLKNCKYLEVLLKGQSVLVSKLFQYFCLFLKQYNQCGVSRINVDSIITPRYLT